MRIRVAAEVIDWIIDNTLKDRSYGARPLRRALQKYVEDPLSEALIQGALAASPVVEVFVEGDELAHRPAGVEEPGDALLIH